MNPRIITVDHFDKFEEAICKMEYRYWVFRGHGNIDWRIEPTLARYYRSHQHNIKTASFYPREGDSVEKFRKSAHLYLHHLPADKDWLSWLAVMQHFGAPTRLIDFTFSPYAALFFALEKSTSDIKLGETVESKDLESKYRPYEVHAIHLRSVRLHAQPILGHGGPPKTDDYLIGQRGQSKRFVGFFEGDWRNQRQTAQQGLFMVPSTIDMDIETYLKSCPTTSTDFPGSAWVRFQFPGGLKAYSKMVLRLLRANVTAEALFPGLDGAARSISMGYYVPKIGLH